MLYKTENKYHKNSPKKKLLVGAAIILVFAAVLATLELTGMTNFYEKPLTDAQKAANERAKQDNVDGQLDGENSNTGNDTEPADKPVSSSDSNGRPASTPSLKVVNPVLAQYGNYNGNVEASGYVDGVREDGGTCTYTFTNSAGTSFSRTSQGAEDASNTGCATITVPRSDFGNAGKWTLVLSYASSTSTGKSAAGSFNVN